MRIFRYLKFFDNGNKLIEYSVKQEYLEIIVTKGEYKHNGAFYSLERTKETKHYHINNDRPAKKPFCVINDRNEFDNLMKELATQNYKLISEN